MMDGSGQLPLHAAVKLSQYDLVETMLEQHLTLLHRENATGQTPLELAETMYLQYHMRHPPDLKDGSYIKYSPFKDQRPHLIGCHGETAEPDVRRTWHICKKVAESLPTNRTLVSLNDANEVSRRLPKQQRRQSGEQVDARLAKEEKFKARDEVLQWLREAIRARR